MMSSVLLNPQLIMYSTALGMTALVIRIVSCTVCGIVAGIVVHLFYKDKHFFNFEGFEPRASCDTNPNLFLRFLFNLGRNIKATGVYFLLCVLLSALFQRYVPADKFAALFGEANEGFGVLMAATIGVPLYACGGGTIPLIREWLMMGMSMGSASAFMITGPATKITNLGALKIVLGNAGDRRRWRKQGAGVGAAVEKCPRFKRKHFSGTARGPKPRLLLYLAFVMTFSLATGLLVNIII